MGFAGKGIDRWCGDACRQCCSSLREYVANGLDCGAVRDGGVAVVGLHLLEDGLYGGKAAALVDAHPGKCSSNA